jgi:2-C-methyl-D-erythritol 4-phosphate cytidylyltransferase
MTAPSYLWALVPAAGAGRRMGALIPKQYLPLGGKTVLEITLGKLQSVPAIENVIVALAEDDERFSQLECASTVVKVTGGAERADSVYRGLVWLMEQGRARDWVLVHATPVADTLKKSAGDQVAHTVSRDHLWAAHTPQMFRVGELFKALVTALEAGLPVTDEASAIEHAGGQVQLVPDGRDNIKITQPEDLNLAEQILLWQRSVSRSG